MCEKIYPSNVTYVSAVKSQKADFLCKARIVSVWSPVSCTGCSRKLENYVTSLRCNRCVSPNVTGVIRQEIKKTRPCPKEN